MICEILVSRFFNIKVLFLIFLTSNSYADNWTFGHNQYIGGFFNYDAQILDGIFYPCRIHSTEVLAYREDRRQIWSIGYANYYKHEQLGKRINIGFTWQRPLLKTTKFKLYFDLNIGFAYFTNHFQKDTTNTAIGFEAAYALSPRLNSEINLSPQWQLTSILKFEHFSNASFVIPNRGLNEFSFGLGLLYTFRRLEDKKFEPIDFLTLDKTWVYSIYTSFAAKEVSTRNINRTSDQKYFIYALNFSIERYLNNKYSLVSSIETFYNTSLEFELLNIVRNYPNIKVEDISSFQATIDFGFGLWAGQRTQFSFRLGTYLYQSHKFFDTIYQRYALRYYFHRHIFAQASLKTNIVIPDFMDFGIGLRF